MSDRTYKLIATALVMAAVGVAAFLPAAFAEKLMMIALSFSGGVFGMQLGGKK